MLWQIDIRIKWIIPLVLSPLIFQYGLSEFALSSGKEGDTGKIILKIDNIKVEEGGRLIIALFNSDETWLKTEKALERRIVPVRWKSMTVTFDSIHYSSSYAIQVFHDRNGNGRLDLRIFPFPRPEEGVGVSNNNIRRGPPLFEEANFDLREPVLVLQIMMHY